MSLFKTTAMRIPPPLALAALILSALGLAWVVGIFVGRSGESPTVVAAVLTAILTLAGGAVFFKDRNGNRPVDPAIGLFCVTVFSATILLSAMFATEQHQLGAVKEKFDHFIACTEAELEINALRRKKGLEPLAKETFCGE